MDTLGVPPAAALVEVSPPDPPEVTTLVVLEVAPAPEVEPPLPTVVLLAPLSVAVDTAELVLVASADALEGVPFASGPEFSGSPPPQAHNRVHPMKPWQRQLMRLNVAPATVTRKRHPNRLLAWRILSCARENRDHADAGRVGVRVI